MPPSSSLRPPTGLFSWFKRVQPADGKEREGLFFSFLLILGLGYGAFALVSWSLGFEMGVWGPMRGHREVHRGEGAAPTKNGLAFSQWPNQPKTEVASISRRIL